MGGSATSYGRQPLKNNYGWTADNALIGAPKMDGLETFIYLDKSRNDWIAKATAPAPVPPPPPPPPPPQGVAEAPVGSKATSTEAAKLRAAQNKGSTGTGQSSTTPNSNSSSGTGQSKATSNLTGGAEESIVTLAPTSFTSRVKTLLGL